MKNKVIIIDDHALFNEGLSLILKESGEFNVIKQIYDSRQACYHCQLLVPELVLIDFNMPYLNGLEVAKQLKEILSLSKIVVISMYAEPREIALFKEVGVDGYISKTTTGVALITALKKIMSGETFFEKPMEKKTAEKDSFALQYQLTKREMEVLKNIKKGFTTEQIAKQLGLSFYTVETHRKNINQKLKFKTRKEFYDFLEMIQIND